MHLEDSFHGRQAAGHPEVNSLHGLVADILSVLAVDLISLSMGVLCLRRVVHLLQAYEALEERIREGDASTSGGGPKVVERQWLRVHVDLCLADSMDEIPRLGCAPASTMCDNTDFTLCCDVEALHGATLWFAAEVTSVGKPWVTIKGLKKFRHAFALWKHTCAYPDKLMFPADHGASWHY